MVAETVPPGIAIPILGSGRAGVTAEIVLCEQCQRPVEATDLTSIPATRRKRVIDPAAHTSGWIDDAEVVFHASCYPMGSRAYLRHR